MPESKTNDFLEKEHLGRLMVKYSIPCVISLLIATLYNIVDQIFIANADYLGSYGNAANSVVFPLTVFALAVAMMIGDGCCTFVSIHLGAREPEQARRGVGSSVIALVAAGIVLMLLFLIFQEPILTMFGARVNETTFQMSKEYFFWITLGIPSYMFGQAVNPIVRSDGSPRFAMVTLVLGGVINVILDPIFIFGFRWGMTGAAIATSLGQVVSALMFAGYLFKMKAVRLDRDSFKFRPRLLGKILRLGITSFLTQLSVVLSMAAVLNMVAKYGALDPVFGQVEFSHIPTAVVGIVMKFFQILVSIAVGLSSGCIPISGYNYGAKRFDRVRKLMHMLTLAEAAVGLVATVIFLCFPRQLAMLLGAANESVYYMDFSVKCIRLFLCSNILACVNKGAVLFLQSLGKSMESTALSMLREIVLGISLPLILPIFFGLDGILYFMAGADVVTLIATILIMTHVDRSLIMTHVDRSLRAQSIDAAR